MKHEELIRIVPEAKTAVLMIHGICGSPNQFRGILPLEDTVPENWTLYNIVLDGHCKSVKDFAHSSMKKWKAQVWQVFDRLASDHEQVILVAHSMGTLFAIQLSVEYPGKIPFMLLLNVPIAISLRLNGIHNILKMPFGKLNMTDPRQAAIANATGITMTKKLWKYIPWLGRVIEVLAECEKTRKMIPQITVPCFAYQSQRDELVANRSRKILAQNIAIKVYNMTGSTHYYYGPEDKASVRETFTRVCNKM